MQLTDRTTVAKVPLTGLSSAAPADTAKLSARAILDKVEVDR
jgi:hypothetical protein